MKIQQPSMRVDKWLWAARFFKTRVAASEAICGGKVHINGERVKPARRLRPGDCLQITRGQEHMTIEVKGLNAQRRPYREAQLLYAESEDSRIRREQELERRRMFRDLTPTPARRPNKHERRKIRRLTGKS